MFDSADTTDGVVRTADNDPRTALCPNCHFDLRTLPVAAHYCPHCGSDVQPKPVLPLISKIPPLPHLERFSHQPVRSSILRGFAAALYRLGQRYESGLGAASNLSEAHRCYCKAAKLGNQAAQEKLNDRPVQSL